MKKMIFILLGIAILSQVSIAQKVSASKVPQAVTKTFKSKFPAAGSIKWELENADYEANFKMNGKEMSANFDKMGTWVETETEIKVSALPAAVRSTLSKEYSGFKIEEASQIESAKNGSCYEAEIEKGKESYDVLFTADGKFLSKTKEK